MTHIQCKVDDKDKFIKVIQNLSKLTSLYLHNKNYTLSQNFLSLSKLSRDSRKMFNLFGSVHQLKELNHFLSKKNIKNSSKSDIIIHISKFFYYLFDNLNLLSRLRVIPFNHIICGQMSNIFYGTIIISAICKDLYQMYLLIEEKEKKEKEGSSNSDDKVINELKYKILLKFVSFTGKFADLLNLLNKSGIIKILIGRRFSEGFIALSGIWSGVNALFDIAHKEK